MTTAALERLERRFDGAEQRMDLLVREQRVDFCWLLVIRLGGFSAMIGGFGATLGRDGPGLPPAVSRPHRPIGRNLLADLPMDWDAPAIVLDARPYGEGDAIATVMTAEHGAHRGLARGGAARSRAAIWQPGNLVHVRWVARLAEQLGSFSAELVHPGAALAMDDALALSMLSAACAVAEGALPERQSHPRVFDGLLHLIAHLSQGAVMLTDLVRWETVLLADLGYGLDLASCAVTGETTGLAFVSPKTGRAVTAAGADVWASRLLRLPPFLGGGNDATPADWRDGLRLTGHFLERDAFGHHHRPLPAARRMLYDRVAALAAESEQQNAG